MVQTPHGRLLESVVSCTEEILCLVFSCCWQLVKEISRTFPVVNVLNNISHSHYVEQNVAQCQQYGAVLTHPVFEKLKMNHCTEKQQTKFSS